MLTKNPPADVFGRGRSAGRVPSPPHNAALPGGNTQKIAAWRSGKAVTCPCPMLPYGHEAVQSCHARMISNRPRPVRHSDSLGRGEHFLPLSLQRAGVNIWIGVPYALTLVMTLNESQNLFDPTTLGRLRPMAEMTKQQACQHSTGRLVVFLALFSVAFCLCLARRLWLDEGGQGLRLLSAETGTARQRVYTFRRLPLLDNVERINRHGKSGWSA